MFMHPTPIESTYDEILGYHAGQRLFAVSPSLNEHDILVSAWMQCKEANAEFPPIKCAEFVPACLQGYQDEVNGLAHPLSESEEE